MLFSDSDKAHWPLRKEILLKTTAKVFDFQRGGQFLWIKWDYDEKCNSMAALIYYIHLLEDHLDKLTPEEGHEQDIIREDQEDSNTMLFVSISENEPDVVSEIIKHLKIIFEDQTSSNRFNVLENELGEIRRKAKEIKGATGEVDTVEKRDAYKAQVEKCIDWLADYVPTLLKEEDFWTDVFS